MIKLNLQSALQPQTHQGFFHCQMFSSLRIFYSVFSLFCSSLRQPLPPIFPLDRLLPFDIHASNHQPFGVLSIPVSVSCLASSHTLNPNIRLILNRSSSLSLGLLAAGGCGRSVTGWQSCHLLCMYLCLCMCSCVYGERGVKAAVTLSQDHILAVRHAVK